jgi:hypothetical protein
VCLFAHSGVEKEFVDTKGIIRIRKSKKNRQHNGQMEKGQKNKQRSKDEQQALHQKIA